MKTMTSILSAVLLGLGFIVLIAFLGHTEFSFDPFYIKMHAWKNVVGYLLALGAICFLGLEQYERGYKAALEEFNVTIKKKQEVIYMLRKSSPEIIEKLESMGKEKLEFSKDSGWTMVLGDSFIIVPPKEYISGEDMIGIVDCGEDEEVFFELLTKQEEL